jgi:hypothetical protein
MALYRLDWPTRNAKRPVSIEKLVSGRVETDYDEAVN